MQVTHYSANVWVILHVDLVNTCNTVSYIALVLGGKLGRWVRWGHNKGRWVGGRLGMEHEANTIYMAHMMLFQQL